MKNKLLVLTLCFTLVFGSLNLRKSYADSGIISLPILAAVSALAVGSGIVIQGNDDLYDIGRLFYDYVDKHNDLTWSTIQTVFASSVSLQPNKLVSVESEFLDIVKCFFDKTFSSSNSSIILDCFNSNNFPSKVLGVPIEFLNGTYNSSSSIVNGGYVAGNMRFVLSHNYNNNYSFYILNALDNKLLFSINLDAKNTYFDYEVTKIVNGLIHFSVSLHYLGDGYVRNYNYNIQSSAVIGGFSDFPYYGGYTWDNLESKKENESVSLPIPGNLGQLVGQNSNDFWGNSDGLVGQGGLELPSVDSPSIGVDNSVSTFPVIDSPVVDSPSAPNEGIWSTIKEFIIGLVVPSDTYWTDTWGGLYNNFTNSFPMVDMDGFNDLVTGEKKFPNIDVNIMGITGRVVNGDVINSIVDWLRPIVAGFMMLCLMLFNYRKIYKLIRNTEPFGGIASGTSDFSTGITEYSKQEVVKATDMVAEYRAWKERGGK